MMMKIRRIAGFFDKKIGNNFMFYSIMSMI